MADRSTQRKSTPPFTAEERAAMKERSREARRSSTADGESEVLAKIAEMKGSDRDMAQRLHELIKDSGAGLTPRTWYGMPAYANGDKVVCFFKPAAKFKNRYATLGFSDKALLDDGAMWPTEFALKELTAGEEARIRELVQRAVG